MDVYEININIQTFLSQEPPPVVRDDDDEDEDDEDDDGDLSKYDIWGDEDDDEATKDDKVSNRSVSERQVRLAFPNFFSLTCFILIDIV